ncbi:MAG: MBL fold metallo-hydrolase [Oscillospiraceae bacterium]|nr:MBL fold metallo-hydrolase [Oscillospiraceae bacterium]
MKITEKIEMLEVKNDYGTIYPTLLHDEQNLILVDTGFPMQSEYIIKEMEKLGFDPKKITGIMLTHSDIDHIGGIKDFKKLSKEAQVMAYKDEAPYISNEKTPIKLAAFEKSDIPEEKKQWYTMMKQGFEASYTNVDKTLSDGEVLQVCGGIEVIHTPGHTPGHMCLYCKEGKVLISGDALNIKDGKLIGSKPEHTHDMKLALESVKKLESYEINSIILYHGGLYTSNIKEALKEIVDETVSH